MTKERILHLEVAKYSEDSLDILETQFRLGVYSYLNLNDLAFKICSISQKERNIVLNFSSALNLTYNVDKNLDFYRNYLKFLLSSSVMIPISGDNEHSWRHLRPLLEAARFYEKKICFEIVFDGDISQIYDFFGILSSFMLNIYG